MNSVKGKFGAIKMKYLIFVFAVALLAALPTRVYQLLALVDENGFFNGSDATVTVLYIALGVFCVLFMVLSYLSKEVPSPKLPVGKNPILGISSLFMVAGLIWEIISIERAIVPPANDIIPQQLKQVFINNIQANGGIVLILEVVFAVFSIFWFLVFAICHLNGKASYKEFKLLALTPVCWATVSLVGRLMTAVSFIRVSDLLFEIFMFVFAMLFFLTYARISTGVFTENSMWGIYGYGFCASAFAGLVSVPRLVCEFAGKAPAEGYEFSFIHFAAFIFMVSYIFASLGIGFDGGLRKIKEISEIDLPDDNEVVVKHAGSSKIQVEEDEYENLLLSFEEEFGAEESDEETAEDNTAEDNADEETAIEGEPAQEEDFLVSFEDEILEEAAEEAIEVEDEILEEAAEKAIEDEDEIFEEAAEEAAEDEDEIPEEAAEETIEDEDEIPEEAAEEAIEVEDEIPEEAAEKTQNFDELIQSFEDPAAVASATDFEPSFEAAPEKKSFIKKAKKEKKSVKSLFGLKAAPENDVLTAEELKPISLADLKKNKED